VPPSETGEPLNLRAPLHVIGDNDARFNRSVSVGRDLAVTGELTVDGVSVSAPPRIEQQAHTAGVARWREHLALSRSGGAGALSSIILVVGDSRVRSSAALYRNSWPDRLIRRFLGATPGSLGVLPASGNLGGVTDADWPGGDNPWTFTGAVVGNVNYGLGFHAITIPAAATATITYFGDKFTLFYVRTADGPTAATITLDGTALATLNARGAALAGQQAQRGTHGDYGHHTVVVTPNDGPLVLEGVQWFDGDAPFFVSGSVQLFDASHAGFGAANWAGANNDWSAMLEGADGFFGMGLTMLGVNDIAAGRTPAQFRDDLVTLVRRVDTRLGTSTLSWLFTDLPTTINAHGYTDTLPFVQAMREAAEMVGVGRASVFDMGALRPGRTWGSILSGDTSHPNDSGHIWIAEALGQVLDPTPTTVSPATPKQVVIEASQLADGRLSWTEAWAAIAGAAAGYDEATTGATVRERRHRVWLDAGTYRATVTFQHATGNGTGQVLIGRWVGNTPTLTSCGTVDTSTPAGPAFTTTRLGTTVATAVAGWHPVVIRKTAVNAPVRFVRLVLDKVA
jgi:hypothetical protein